MDEAAHDKSCSGTSIANATQFGKSLKELRELSSQLYHVADYCETAFGRFQDKTLIMEATKDYISQAVVTVVDHLGSMSALLECTMSASNSLPQTEYRIQSLKLRIGTCQQHSLKLALDRFRWSTEFSRHHCCCIVLPLKDRSTMISPASTWDHISYIDAESDNGNGIQKEPQPSDNKKCKKYTIDIEMEKDDQVSPAAHLSRDYKDTNLLPVHDGLSTLLKPKQYSNFQFQETRHKLKRSMINLRKVQNKDTKAALIRHGKRILDTVGV